MGEITAASSRTLQDGLKIKSPPFPKAGYLLKAPEGHPERWGTTKGSLKGIHRYLSSIFENGRNYPLSSFRTEG